MKAHNFLFLSIIIIFVNYSAQKYLTLTTHKSNRFTSNNGAQDLIGKRVECPNRGVLKNFVLKKQGKEYYYEYQCYSSNSNGIDEGEPITKGMSLNYVQYNKGSISKSLESFDGVLFQCFVDYGMNSFEIVKDTSNAFRSLGICKPLKTKSKTIGIKSKEKSGKETDLDNLVDITVGPTNTETDSDIAFVLREFKYNVKTGWFNFITKKATIYYTYSYSVVKNMKTVTNNYKTNFEKLRNGNNQKN